MTDEKDAPYLRLFKYRVLPGMADAYRDYLRDSVEPIDASAHRDDAFVAVATITPAMPSDCTPTQWTSGRLFRFRDTAQRGRFAEAMSRASLAFDGSEATRSARKAYAETLRQAVAICDYELS